MKSGYVGGRETSTNIYKKQHLRKINIPMERPKRDYNKFRNETNKGENRNNQDHCGEALAHSVDTSRGWNMFNMRGITAHISEKRGSSDSAISAA